jgi:hypothetical protein
MHSHCLGKKGKDHGCKDQQQGQQQESPPPVHAQHPDKDKQIYRKKKKIGNMLRDKGQHGDHVKNDPDQEKYPDSGNDSVFRHLMLKQFRSWLV